jgi:hypothetical protein
VGERRLSGRQPFTSTIHVTVSAAFAVGLNGGGIFYGPKLIRAVRWERISLAGARFSAYSVARAGWALTQRDGLCGDAGGRSNYSIDAPELDRLNHGRSN